MPVPSETPGRMSDAPLTRASLLVRIRDGRDHEAWRQFVQVYAPVVYGFARSEAWGKGLAAGITIVLLGVMLDRITRAAADVRRDDGPGPRRAFHLRLPIGPPR